MSLVTKQNIIHSIHTKAAEDILVVSIYSQPKRLWVPSPIVTAYNPYLLINVINQQQSLQDSIETFLMNVIF